MEDIRNTVSESKHQPRALIIDDETDIGEVYSEYFRLNGVPSCYAEDLDQAIKALEFHNIFLMVVDYRLRSMDGLELLRRLEAIGRVLPAICMYTAYASDVDLAEAYKLHVSLVLSKPLPLPKFSDLIKTMASIEQRRNSRKWIRVTAHLDAEAGSSHFKLINISCGGCMLQSPDEMSPVLRLTLLPASGLKISLLAKKVWSTQGMTGYAFDDLDESNRVEVLRLTSLCATQEINAVA